MKDYCGPAGNGFFAKFLSWLIPDNISLKNGSVVNIGEICCKAHDDDNSANGANKAGDEKFKNCIRQRLRKAGATKREVLWHSNKYFAGVRFGNPFYKNYSTIKIDINREFKRLINRIKRR